MAEHIGIVVKTESSDFARLLLIAKVPAEDFSQTLMVAGVVWQAQKWKAALSIP